MAPHCDFCAAWNLDPLHFLSTSQKSIRTFLIFGAQALPTSRCTANLADYMDHVGQLQIGAKAATWKSPSALRAAEDLWRGARRGAHAGIGIELPPHRWVWGPSPEDAAVAVAAAVMVLVAIVVVLFPLLWEDPNSQVMDQALHVVVQVFLLVLPRGARRRAAQGPPVAGTNPGRGGRRLEHQLLLRVPVIQDLSNHMVLRGGALPVPVPVPFVLLAPQLGHTPSAEVVTAADGHGVLKVIQADGAHRFLAQGLHRAGGPRRGCHRGASSRFCGNSRGAGLAALPDPTRPCPALPGPGARGPPLGLRKEREGGRRGLSQPGRQGQAVRCRHAEG